MAYKHILIAVEIFPESKVFIEAVSMARPYNAKSSLDPRRCKLL